MKIQGMEFSTPENWVDAPLMEICNPKQWKTISTSELTNEGYVVYGANGKIGFYSEYTHERPTLMITCRGATCGNVHVSEPFAYINGNAMALDGLSDECISLKYFYYSLIARKFDDVISGSAQPQITRQGLEPVTVPLPPLAEQKQIAAILDELLAQVDTLQARLDAIPAILKRFRQSVLAAAVSGRLTGSSENSGDDHINQKSISDVANVVSGIAFKKAQYSSAGNRLLQIANVSYGFTLWDEKNYIPAELAEEYREHALQVDDIVLALNRPITNGILKVARISSSDLPSTLYQRVARLRIKDHKSIIGDYLYLAMRSEHFKKQVELNLKGSDQPYLNTSNLSDLQIFVPSIQEQTQIVQRVEELFAFADQIEQRASAAIKDIAPLRQSILGKAFRGELTAQWRAENPELISGENSAQALLERIRAGREDSLSKKRGRNRAGT